MKNGDSTLDAGAGVIDAMVGGAQAAESVIGASRDFLEAFSELLETCVVV